MSSIARVAVAAFLVSIVWGVAAVGSPAEAQAPQWVRGYPSAGNPAFGMISECVYYVAQWSDGTYTATPWDCQPGIAVQADGAASTRGYPQLASNGCVEYVTQWSNGTYTWVPFSCPAGVTYLKPTWNGPTGPHTRGNEPPEAAGTRQTQMAVAPFQRGHMIWRQDRSRIYVLYNDGTYEVFSDTWQPGDPVSGGQTPPTGLIEPVRGFGKVWRENAQVRDRLGWQLAPEQGLTGTVIVEGTTTTIDAKGLGRWVLQQDRTFQKVR